MTPSRSVIVLCLWGALAAASAGAEATTAVVKTGGGFDVEHVRDLAYRDDKDADPVKHKLDLYLPKGQKDFPVLFFVHGGGWRQGDKKIYGGIGQVFARNGIGTVVTNYRLSPGVQHPEHIKDVARAFAWTHAHIAKYGGNPDQIFVSGHSAGAHLVALLATDESYLKAEKLSLAAIQGALPLSGVYTITPARYFEPVFGKDPDVCRKASPEAHVNGKHPPMLIVYAEKDLGTIDTMSQHFHKTLQGAKCAADLLEVKDRDHISIIIRIANEDDPATQAMLEFIANHSGLKLTPREPALESKP
jgi:acetyl esterase/lipase